MISIEANHQKGRMCDSGDSRHLSATPRALYEYHYQCGLEAMTVDTRFEMCMQIPDSN